MVGIQCRLWNRQLIFLTDKGGSRTWGEKTEDIEPGQTEACPRKAAMTGSLFNIERVLTPGHHEWRRNDVIPGAFPLQQSSFHMARRIIPKLIQLKLWV